MFPLFETIRIEGGIPANLSYHNERMNRSRRELYGLGDPLDLAAAIRVPDGDGSGVTKCRVAYGESIGDVTFTAYEPRPVRTLSIVDGGGIDYPHKFVDRSGIERLAAGVSTDDILIVKNGLVTDASFANVAFFDGSAWLTPSTPLLPGTTRARLLDVGLVRPAEISVSGIRSFAAAALMNAMIGFDTAHPVAIDAIEGA
jgi:4-amino-4-deoxychorismate lyase